MLSFGIKLVGSSQVERSSSDPQSSGATLPVSPTTHQVWLLTQTEGQRAPGLYVYVDEKSDWFPQLSDVHTYDIGMSFSRRYIASDILASFAVARVMRIHANFANSLGLAKVPALAQADLYVYVEDGVTEVRTLIGTIRFAAAAKTAQFIPAVADTEHVLVPGDLITIEASEVADADLNKVTVTLAGTLIV